MMDAVPSPVRPAEGQGVNIVVLGGPDLFIAGARVLLDRGRGIVIETERFPGAGWSRGARALLVFSLDDRVWQIRCSIGEVLTKTRFYVLPSAAAVEMEKREYIRATVTVRAALAAGAEPPEPAPPLAPMPIELSASGFRWLGDLHVIPGSTIWLYLEDEARRRMRIPTEVVRVDSHGDTIEVAGRFLAIEPDDRDAVLRIVFRARQSELGLDDL